MRTADPVQAVLFVTSPALSGGSRIDPTRCECVGDVVKGTIVLHGKATAAMEKLDITHREAKMVFAVADLNLKLRPCRTSRDQDPLNVFASRTI